MYDGKFYFGLLASGVQVNNLILNNNFTISFTVNTTIYQNSVYPNHWFVLSTSDGTRFVNICGGGSFTTPTTYNYNGGNSSYNNTTNIMSLSFLLPSQNITLTETFGASFTLIPGNYLLKAYCANSNYSQILEMISNPISIINGLICFKEDTKILTDQGYKLIQELKTGDMVKTYQDDYKPIFKILMKEIYHVAIENKIKDQLYKYTKNEYPEIFEDLVITGNHCILIDKYPQKKEEEYAIRIFGIERYKINDKYLLLSWRDNNSKVLETPGKYNIYHLSLENTDTFSIYGIYANGLLVESCSINSISYF